MKHFLFSFFRSLLFRCVWLFSLCFSFLFQLRLHHICTYFGKLTLPIFPYFYFFILFLHFICLNHTIKYHLTVTFRFIDHVHATFDWLIFIFFLFAHSSHSHLLFCSILSGQTFSIHFNFHKIIFMTQKKILFQFMLFSPLHPLTPSSFWHYHRPTNRTSLSTNPPYSCPSKTISIY